MPQWIPVVSAVSEVADGIGRRLAVPWIPLAHLGARQLSSPGDEFVYLGIDFIRHDFPPRPSNEQLVR